MKAFLLRLATFFGAGLMPKGPGTWGTVATLPLALLLIWAGPFWHMGFVILMLPMSIWASDVYERESGREDASEIVIDEVVGFLIAMVWLPLTWQSFVAGFVLFRFFDIVKPWPISVLNDRVKGGFGVVIDDVAAGLVSNIILQIVLAHTSWLGVQQIVVGGSGT